MGVETAIAVSAGATLVSGLIQADAASKSANAQLRAQQDYQNTVLATAAKDRELALQYAKLTPEELNSINEMNQLNLRDIARKEKLLATVDPALMEAGVQAQKLLAGEDARSLAPIRNERARQRQALEEKLRGQLGSGYASSTAGLQALNDFDRQTGNLLADAQNQTLNQLLGVSQNVANISSINPNLQNSAAITELLGKGRQNSLNAVLGTRAWNIPSTTEYAGAPFVNQMMQGQTLNNMGQTAGNYMMLNQLFNQPGSGSNYWNLPNETGVTNGQGVF